MPRLPFVMRWKALCLAVLAPVALPAATYTHTFNSVPVDTPNGATNTALTLGGGLLNGAAANATLISNRRDTNGAGTSNVGVVKAGVGAGGDIALRLADKATGSATAALVLPVLDANATVTEFTVTLRLLLERTGSAVPADGFNISFGPVLSGAGGAFSQVAAGAMQVVAGRRVGMGSVLGLGSMGNGIGIVIGSVVGGLLIDLIALPAAFVFGGCAMFLGMLAFLQLTRGVRTNELDGEQILSETTASTV